MTTSLEKILSKGGQVAVHRHKTKNAVIIAIRYKPGNGHRIYERTVSLDDYTVEQALGIAALECWCKFNWDKIARERGLNGGM